MIVENEKGEKMTKAQFHTRREARSLNGGRM